MMIWFLFETILYVPTLIFASDIYGRPRSYRRSMLLLFLNYMEITFAFAAIYATGVYLNRPFEHWIDPIYFSFITSATIGFGDYHPASTLGRILVSIQTIVFLIFVLTFSGCLIRMWSWHKTETIYAYGTILKRMKK